MTLLLLFPSLTGVPSVTVSSPTLITTIGATLHADVENTGPGSLIERGFEWNTVAAVDIDHRYGYQGSYSAEPFSHAITGLTPGTLYFFRAYVIDIDGTYYSEWMSFTTSASTYSISINGINRTTDVLNKSIVIDDTINDQQNSCTLSLIDRSGNGIPSTDQEVIITMDDGTILFGGYILSLELSKHSQGTIQADITCTDYSRLLDRNLVNRTYEEMTDAAIVRDIIDTYCPGFGITTNNVLTGVTIDQISFNYIQPSQAFRKLADITGRNWYIDYAKDIHFFPLTTNAAPYNITSSANAYTDLRISKDASQLKNRVYVRGGTKLSEPTTYEVKGDGVATKFPLPDKPHDTSLTVNGVSKTLGIKNIDLSGYDFYLNFQEKYIEQDSGGAVLTSSDTLALTYSYDIPILVAIENTASIAANGVKEFAIFDKKISTTQAARDRASAELTDYATSIIEGSFTTLTPGFRSGQYINITLDEYGVSADYLVQKVVAKSFGAGYYEYQISIASAKTMGIIRFLIELLETQQNVVELSNNEVIDELLNVTDSLLSDSIVDNLTTDSTGPYFTWCPDSLVSTPITRAVWNLFQWG